jgi:(2Fe-2S) ferredoxin
VDFLEDELSRLALEERVTVYPGGCQNHCDSGPTMVVYPGPVFYQEVDRERILRIATEHLAADRPVAEYFWQDVSAYKPMRPAKVAFNFESFPVPKETKQNEQPSKQPKKKTFDVDDFKW